MIRRALDLDRDTICRKRDLLAGICAEAVALPKEARFHQDVTRHLRKMKPARQVECVVLMLSVNNFSAPYAEALLAATPAGQLVDPGQPKKMRGLSMDQVARMEQEMSLVQSRFKVIEQTSNRDVMQLVPARGDVAKLRGNEAVTRWLDRHQPKEGVRPVPDGPSQVFAWLQQCPKGMRGLDRKATSWCEPKRNWRRGGSALSVRYRFLIGLHQHLTARPWKPAPPVAPRFLDEVAGIRLGTSSVRVHDQATQSGEDCHAASALSSDQYGNLLDAAAPQS